MQDLLGYSLGNLKELSDVEYHDISRSCQHRFPNVRLPRQAWYVTATAKNSSSEQVQRFAKGDTSKFLSHMRMRLLNMNWSDLRFNV